MYEPEGQIAVTDLHVEFDLNLCGTKSVNPSRIFPPNSPYHCDKRSYSLMRFSPDNTSFLLWAQEDVLELLK